MTVLAGAAGLANVFAFGFAMLADGFAIRHLRLADVGFDFVFAHHAVNDDFQMQLAHAADDGLSAVGIGVNLEGGIFLRQPAQRHAHFFLIGFGLGLDRDRNNRHRKRDRFQQRSDAFSSQMVSPVVTFFRPTQAQISPARISLMSSRLLACIFSRRPMRSDLPRAWSSYTESPDFSCPE